MFLITPTSIESIIFVYNPCEMPTKIIQYLWQPQFLALINNRRLTFLKNEKKQQFGDFAIDEYTFINE